ncbi:MAG: hypothetical protein IJU44_06285 [Kiritimatiellae bacterium]|nr:hypothetical protein [Kiritimatiellia bacterium]
MRSMVFAFAVAGMCASVALAQGPAPTVPNLPAGEKPKVIVPPKPEAKPVTLPIPTKKEWTPEQIRERDERVMKKTGGLLDVAPSGPEVLLVDTRTMPGTAAGQVAEVFGRAAKMRVRATNVARSPDTALALAQKLLNDNRALMVLLVAEEKTAPALAVYPEERVAVVNADRLGEGVEAPAKEIRIIKELWRGLGMIGGAGYSAQDNCVMQPVFSLKELDETKFQVMQPINYPKMYKMFNKFGVKRSRRIPYRLAVREGWANAPTNDYQKAIWEEEKAKMKDAANK